MSISTQSITVWDTDVAEASRVDRTPFLFPKLESPFPVSTTCCVRFLSKKICYIIAVRHQPTDRTQNCSKSTLYVATSSCVFRFFPDNFSLRHAAGRGNWRRRIQFRKEKWRPVSSSRRLSCLGVSSCNGIRACACDLYQLSLGSFALGRYVRAWQTRALGNQCSCQWTDEAWLRRSQRRWEIESRDSSPTDQSTAPCGPVPRPAATWAWPGTGRRSLTALPVILTGARC